MTRLKALRGAALLLCLIAPQAALAGSKSGVDGTIDVSVVGSITSSSVGSTSNATDAQATSTNNQSSVDWLYGFNGATWDRLQVDASKNLKVVVGALPTGTNTIGAVSIVPTASGGSTTLCSLTIKATATVCDASPGQISGLIVDNIGNTAPVDLAIYNVAVGSVTVGTTPATKCIAVPGAAIITYYPPGGLAYGTAITMAATLQTAATAGSCAGTTVATNNLALTVDGK